MKILLTGASGCLGQELLKINPNIIWFSHKEMDVSNRTDCEIFIREFNPDIIIHAAAVTDNRLVEKNPISAIKTNIIGTANLAMLCRMHNIRLVYISTDYVYSDGSHGNYKETDPLLPFNNYSWSKLGGECSVVNVKNHLIIRTSFGKNTFDYKDAFVDKWSSKDYVDKIAPMIYEASISPLTGVLNLGTERKTLYNHASERTVVNPIKIADTNHFTPYDTSLNLQKWIDYKSSEAIAKPHVNCRVCGSDDMVKYLDLGLMPLANNLEYSAKLAKAKDKFPLQVMVCNKCYLSQLSVVIDPEVLFSYYTYRSGVSQGYLNHCDEMAYNLGKQYGINEKTFHIDIAGNDGALLTVFKNRFNHKVLNVDPASNLCAIAESNGIESIPEFWSEKLADKLSKSHGYADLITATNVFAHLDNVEDFILGAKAILSNDGVLVIENPYLTDFIENKEYCQTYFEHVSYLSLFPVMQLCEKTGMKLIDAQHTPIHSGSMRYTICKNTASHVVSNNVIPIHARESLNGYSSIKKYQDYQSEIDLINERFANGLLELKRKGFSIAGFGASAKGNTLLNYAGINTDLMDFIVDETSEKIGKYSPGTGIQIVGKHHLLKHNVDYIVILAWNFEAEIIAKLKSWGYQGKFINPMTFEIK